MRRAIGAYTTLAVLAALTACTSSSTDGSPQSTSTAPLSSPASTPPAPSTPARTSTPASTSALPLGYSTRNASQVITVVATSHSSTSATLQAWHRIGSHWMRVGPAVRARLGSGGIGQASERSTVTPQGSFTLTQAFGRLADPGTALPYRRTTPADWWISQSGRLYNTEQHCISNCPFTQGDPNEHLFYEQPYYRYALVIDYNTRNDPGGVRQGAGSAFFLHVTVGAPTQGCVSIAQDSLVRLLRWLAPADHPRIVIGVG